jgi:hypothetical protein
MFLQLCLGVVVFETCSRNTQSHFTLMALDENFSCHIPGCTHATPQLCLRQDRPTFVAFDFEPIDVCFNISWSA